MYSRRAPSSNTINSLEKKVLNIAPRGQVQTRSPRRCHFSARLVAVMLFLQHNNSSLLFYGRRQRAQNLLGHPRAACSASRSVLILLRNWRNTVGNLIEFLFAQQKPITGLSLLVHAWNTEGYDFIEFEISKQYYFNSIPPTPHLCLSLFFSARSATQASRSLRDPARAGIRPRPRSGLALGLSIMMMIIITHNNDYHYYYHYHYYY